MNFNSSKLFALVLLATSVLFTAQEASAQFTCSTHTITSQTSVSIPQTTHNRTGPISVNLFDSNGVAKLTNTYTNTVNSSYDVSLSFPASFTGSAKICGPFSETTYSYDFRPDHTTTGGGAEAVLNICADCSASPYSARRKNGHAALMSSVHTWQRNVAEGASVTLRVWIANGELVFGISDNNGGSLNPTHGRVRIAPNTTAFPSNVFDIFEGTATKTSGVVTWSNVTDKRGW